ncbi:inositol phospholipid synthesis and fat-storage-inducing TM-domain-containing protein [Dipodascopsis tothii]|uniref:inositol phospholipid synthesis and fat-storage-inducing TM-domain-containing protein n=1 Tax=Dipodascopsis tothii TaxID=44089 RepID=UPI0034CE37D7
MDPSAATASSTAVPDAAHDAPGADVLVGAPAAVPAPAAQETTAPSARRSWLSTTELTVLALYPGILLLGSLVAVVSAPDTYFSRKSNVFNVYFVKKGWFWTTLVFLIHVARTRPTVGTAVRYAVATAYWIAFTQWLFGPPIMDRVFSATGGECRLSDAAPPIRSSAGCRHANGAWDGGHDVSGHAFLLTHASMFLWFELLPVLPAKLSQVHTKIVFGLLGLWAWMLLMTSIYFHTLFEKINGWLCGLVSWAVVYVLYPRLHSK